METDGSYEKRSGSSASGSDSVSFSKMTTFKSCRRKFYYRYKRGLQRVGEKATALRLGSLIHLGLENYYQTLITKEQADAWKY